MDSLLFAIPVPMLAAICGRRWDTACIGGVSLGRGAECRRRRHLQSTTTHLVHTMSRANLLSAMSSCRRNGPVLLLSQSANVRSRGRPQTYRRRRSRDGTCRRIHRPRARPHIAPKVRRTIGGSVFVEGLLGEGIRSPAGVCGISSFLKDCPESFRL